MILLKNATIVDPNSKLDGKKRDILIEKGKIKEIKTKIVAKAEVIAVEGVHVSPGWLDIGTQIGEPGYEHREDLQSVSRAAAAGGFTGIACFPNTKPVIHSKSEVLYIKNNTQDSLVDFFPLAAASQNAEGKEITEMLDMHHAGAVGFTDGRTSIQNSGLMMRALEYVKSFNGLILNQAHDHSVDLDGQMHEGMISTSLGMKGISNLSEELMVQRDLYLAAYTDSRLHISNISTVGAVELIRRAKKKGVAVTCSVAAINLLLDDSELTTFESNYKVFPPLRSLEDIKALKKGLEDGTIDHITSNHCPWEAESKHLEFPYAEFGVIGLETSFAVAHTALGNKLTLSQLIDRLSIQPRKILGIELPTVAEGAAANLSLFLPKATWTFEAKDIYSKSKNTPFVGRSFTGKVVGVINHGQYLLN
ncbi:MAG: dihydroorotase family protein [Saprospiraceae bacterium]